MQGFINLMLSLALLVYLMGIFYTAIVAYAQAVEDPDHANEKRWVLKLSAVSVALIWPLILVADLVRRKI